jgi:hypothetical protein
MYDECAGRNDVKESGDSMNVDEQGRKGWLLFCCLLLLQGRSATISPRSSTLGGDQQIGFCCCLAGWSATLQSKRTGICARGSESDSESEILQRKDGRRTRMAHRGLVRGVSDPGLVCIHSLVDQLLPTSDSQLSPQKVWLLIAIPSLFFLPVAQQPIHHSF